MLNVRQFPNQNKIRFLRLTVIMPRLQLMVFVIATVVGFQIIESKPSTVRREQALAVRGIEFILPLLSFYVLDRNVPKNRFTYHRRGY